MKNRLGMWLLFSIVAGISLDMVAAAKTVLPGTGSGYMPPARTVGRTPLAPAAAAPAAKPQQALTGKLQAAFKGEGATDEFIDYKVRHYLDLLNKDLADKNYDKVKDLLNEFSEKDFDITKITSMNYSDPLRSDLEKQFNAAIEAIEKANSQGLFDGRRLLLEHLETLRDKMFPDKVKKNYEDNRKWFATSKAKHYVKLLDEELSGPDFDKVRDVLHDFMDSDFNAEKARLSPRSDVDLQTQLDAAIAKIKAVKGPFFGSGKEGLLQHLETLKTKLFPETTAAPAAAAAAAAPTPDEAPKALSTKEVVANKIREYKDRLGKFRDAAVEKLNEHREKFVKFGSDAVAKLKNLFTRSSSDDDDSRPAGRDAAPAAAAAAYAGGYDGDSLAATEHDDAPVAAEHARALPAQSRSENTEPSFTERTRNAEIEGYQAPAASAYADAPHAEGM